MDGTAADTVCQTPVRHTPTTSSHSCWETSQNGRELIPIPALATTISIGPTSATPALIIRSISPRSRTSARPA
jgi:hypothetical protein